jgi:hypothetical protein
MGSVEAMDSAHDYLIANTPAAAGGAWPGTSKPDLRLTRRRVVFAAQLLAPFAAQFTRLTGSALAFVCGFPPFRKLPLRDSVSVLSRTQNTSDCDGHFVARRGVHGVVSSSAFMAASRMLTARRMVTRS